MCVPSYARKPLVRPGHLESSATIDGGAVS